MKKTPSVFVLEEEDPDDEVTFLRSLPRRNTASSQPRIRISATSRSGSQGVFRDLAARRPAVENPYPCLDPSLLDKRTTGQQDSCVDAFSGGRKRRYEDTPCEVKAIDTAGSFRQPLSSNPYYIQARKRGRTKGLFQTPTTRPFNQSSPAALINSSPTCNNDGLRLLRLGRGSATRNPKPLQGNPHTLFNNRPAYLQHPPLVNQNSLFSNIAFRSTYTQAPFQAKTRMLSKNGPWDRRILQGSPNFFPYANPYTAYTRRPFQVCPSRFRIPYFHPTLTPRSFPLDRKISFSTDFGSFTGKFDAHPEFKRHQVERDWVGSYHYQDPQSQSWVAENGGPYDVMLRSPEVAVYLDEQRRQKELDAAKAESEMIDDSKQEANRKEN